LSPFVTSLQRRGLNRVLSVLLVLALAFGLLTAIGAVVVLQVRVLAEDLPNHEDVIIRKVEALRTATESSWLDRLTAIFREVSARATASESTPAAAPTPVVIASPDYWFLSSAANPILEFLASAGLVLILTVFMTIHRENVRNRLIRLWHFGSLPRMTRALDD